MTTAQLREACEAAIAHGQNILVQAPDLLALLVALDLREQLDPDVQACARITQTISEVKLESYPNDPVMIEGLRAAQRVLLHDPKPDLSGVPS